MRSEIETNREANSDESSRTASQQESALNEQILNLDQLSKMDKELFNDQTSSQTELQWEMMRSDNYFVKNLKNFLGLFAHAVKKEIEQKEKEIKQARKVFYGK